MLSEAFCARPTETSNPVLRRFTAHPVLCPRRRAPKRSRSFSRMKRVQRCSLLSGKRSPPAGHSPTPCRTRPVVMQRASPDRAPARPPLMGSDERTATGEASMQRLRGQMYRVSSDTACAMFQIQDQNRPLSGHHLFSSIPRSLATCRACAVVDTPSFLRMWRRCIAMVLKLLCRRLAISRVVRPCHTSWRTSCSRGVSGCSFIPDGGRVALLRHHGGTISS